MAEGAHITSAVSNERPSFFEVLAQESLISTVRPALKHAIRVAAESKPDRFGWLLRHYDAVYTGLDFLLEQHYLRKYCSTFAEHFYSLRRVCPDHNGRKLPQAVFWKSLFCAVVLPYVKLKLDELFENMRHAYNTYASNREMSVMGKAFVAVYPYVHTVWEGAFLTYQTAYLFGKTDWHSPYLQFCGVTLINDLEMDEDGHISNVLPWQQMNLKGKLIYSVKKVINLAAISVSTSLSVGVFFIQFLDWWYTNDSSHTSLTSLPVPDPPPKDASQENTQFNVCPICHRTRSNDTVLSVSGYVFCYPCIYDHVKEYKMCPVTKYPARTEHLIKLYISAT